MVRAFGLLCAAHALSSTGGWVRRVVRVGESLQIEVQERAQSDRDHLGGLTWTGGRALAEYLAARPELVEGRRVLELGCGSDADNAAFIRCSTHFGIAIVTGSF